MRWACVIVAAVVWCSGCIPAAAQAVGGAGAEFAGWPPGWVESYQRFEAFAAARRATWPHADLEILPDGSIIHGVRFATGGKEHLSLEFFQRGDAILSMAMAESLLGQRRDRIFSPGTFAAVLKASTQFGYQRLYPIVWFEAPPAAESPEHEAPERMPAIRLVAPPSPGEDVWPNERMLLYLDFQIFPRGHPWDIEKANRKVNPGIVLRLDQHGVVERDLLPQAEWERLLRWRIYRDGVLVEKSTAAEVKQRAITFGVGSYQVWIGVDGPAGFMPVSNVLYFPLFPAAGGFVVIPSDSDGNRVPDFLETAVTANPAVDPTADRDNDGLPDIQESAQPDPHPKPSATETEKRLAKLWSAWRYELKTRPPVAGRAK